MFNEEIKREFINYRLEENNNPFSPRYMDNWFSKSEEFENKYKKDLCNFTREEILAFYKSVDTTSFLTLRTLNSQLKTYNLWCQEKGMVPDYANHFDEVSKQDLFDCINLQKKTNTVITREELEKWCDYDIKNFRDQFIFLCLFEGIKGKDYTEIVNLSFKDLTKEVTEDGEKKYYAHISGDWERTIEISEKLYYTALSAYECDDYVTFGESGKIIKLRQNNQCIFKGFMNQDLVSKSDHQKGKVIYTIVKRNLDAISGKDDKDLKNATDTLSPSQIQTSGMIHFIKVQSEKLGIKPDEYLSKEKYRKNLEYQFGMNVSKIYFIDRNKGLLQ